MSDTVKELTNLVHGSKWAGLDDRTRRLVTAALKKAADRHLSEGGPINLSAPVPSE